MEPCQQVLRTGLDVVVETAERVRVLTDIGRTGKRAVEAQSDAVGLMIVRRRPVGSCAARAVPRFGTVVMGTGKDVMDA